MNDDMEEFALSITISQGGFVIRVDSVDQVVAIEDYNQRSKLEVPIKSLDWLIRKLNVVKAILEG